MIISSRDINLEDAKNLVFAIPGVGTSAYLALRLALGDVKFEVVPFDEIMPSVQRGEYDVGVIIHEGQLTYGSQNLELVVDLGQWWYDKTELPLPLGSNGIRKDLVLPAMDEVTALLKESIVHGLENRAPALDYALGYGRGLDRSMADEFVGMYVNDWTIDFGEKGREAVAELLRRGFEAGVIPELIEPEFIG